MLNDRHTDHVTVTARIAQGLVRGMATTTGAVFRSIPYAAPPTGPLRFAAPVPFPKWTGTRDPARSDRAGAVSPVRGYGPRVDPRTE